ncbi:Rpp14/Pop5 family-domain-containing protein [Aspergillus pseudoustus]|uniref:Ribonuclease P/MRP protein subunit POP5 n=1 Tax=Aspergillus pseudoustus TaxID=1810923 RepID=A0ABR4KB73_9EURO
MVRVKHRYLLVDILYPEPFSSSSISASATKSRAQENQLRIHSPTSDALTPSLLAKMVRDEVAEMFGDWGVGRLGGVGAGGVSVKYLSPATSTAIIRCPRASYRLVWTALTFMSRVPDLKDNGRTLKRGEQATLTRPCVFRVVRVSGTIRKAEEEVVRRARREIVRLRGMVEVDILSGLVGGLEKIERRQDSGVDDNYMDVDVDSEGD